MKPTVVIALGGHAIIRPGQRGTVPEQFENTRLTFTALEAYLKRECSLVITHGNGPQVGNIVIRVEEARRKAYEVPLGVCVAESQGEMGYMIAQSLDNKLHEMNDPRDVVTVLTQSVVSLNDPQLSNPTKPIGPFYSRAEIQHLSHPDIHLTEDPGGLGFRRLVPSPRPIQTVEREVIKKLVLAGVIVVAAGGGGMPVYYDEAGRLEGLDAVVDKDFASALLAHEIGATELVIITSVSHVKVHFGTPQERSLTQVHPGELETYLNDGHFPPGSMGPKIEAAILFINNGGEKVIITSMEGIAGILSGDTKAGTIVTRQGTPRCPTTSCA